MEPQRCCVSVQVSSNDLKSLRLSLKSQFGPKIPLQLVLLSDGEEKEMLEIHYRRRRISNGEF